MSRVQDLFNKIPSVFNAEAAKDVNAIFQWEITGDGGGNWQVIINEGKCEVKEGIHPSPSVSMKMDIETYFSLVNKQLNPIQAFMTGKLKVSGNIILAQKFQNLFDF